MKFIHLSDLHIGKRVNGFSMIEDQAYILEQIVGAVEEEKPDGVIIAGDIYDKPIPPQEAVTLYDRFLTQLSYLEIPVFMISGNHDSAERLAFGNHLLSKSKVYISPVYDGNIAKISLEDTYGKVNIYLLPYIKPVMVKRYYEEEIETYDDAMKVILDHIEVDVDSRNVLVAHQFLTGAVKSESEELSVGGMDNIDASHFDVFDYVALGHIHRPQKVLREEVRYSGTPLKYSFSEANHKKGITVVELREKGTVDIRTLPLHPIRDMREIRGTYEELTMRENYIHTNQEDYLHITLTDEEDILDAVGKLRVIYPNLMKLDYDNQRTREFHQVLEEKNIEQHTPMELMEAFYEKQNNQGLSQEQRRYLEMTIEEIWEDAR